MGSAARPASSAHPRSRLRSTRTSVTFGSENNKIHNKDNDDNGGNDVVARHPHPHPHDQQQHERRQHVVRGSTTRPASARPASATASSARPARKSAPSPHHQQRSTVRPLSSSSTTTLRPDPRTTYGHRAPPLGENQVFLERLEHTGCGADTDVYAPYAPRVRKTPPRDITRLSLNHSRLNLRRCERRWRRRRKRGEAPEGETQDGREGGDGSRDSTPTRALFVKSTGRVEYARGVSAPATEIYAPPPSPRTIEHLCNRGLLKLICTSTVI